MDFLDSAGCFAFGKYGPSRPGKRGAAVGDVADDDPDYLKWVIRETDCSPEDKEIIRTWLRRAGHRV